MKKKALLSSILTLAICLCLIVGSTYALFTSTSELNVEVSSGTIDLFADIKNLQLYSVEATDGGAEEDENGNTYEYVKQGEYFANGGTAVYNNRVLTLTNITPGDKVTFTLTGANTSNVKANYRYGFYCTDGQYLASGLIVTIDGVKYPALDHFVTGWMELPALTDMANVEFAIEMPVSKGNEYQNKSTSFYMVVEAVQFNGVVEDEEEIGYVSIPTTTAELKAAIEDPSVSYVAIAEDISGITEVGNAADVTIDAMGNNVALSFVGTMDNVVVTGIVNDGAAGRSINVGGATGDITITNCTLVSAAGNSGSAIGLGAAANVTVDECTISGQGKSYGVYGYSSGDLTITNSTFTNFGSWAICVNGAVSGSVVIDNNTIDTPDGVFKTLGGGISGDFTFTNNTMLNCKGHDGKPEQMVVSGSGNGPVIYGGTKTVSGNTLDGVEWTQ